MPESFRAILVYIPISVIGIWRWSYWVVRITAAKLYRPKYTEWKKGAARPTVSVVTPVYNEDPDIFAQAMQSWIDNGVDEIVAVIDKTNTRHILNYERTYVPRKDVKCRMIVTPKPGKRAALCDGIVKAKSDIIVLVDSDTIWDDAVMDGALPAFQDPSVGGVTVKQAILNPRGTSDVLFDLLLYTRYREEVPFMLGVGRAFNTLSGRTAFYRREAILPEAHDNIHHLRHEFFFKTRGVSGDDKRLTHLILEQGWHVAYASKGIVKTPGMGDMRKFLKQRLRWTRNSWRADLRAVKRGWVFKHPALAIFMIDRFIQPFIMLIGPTAFAIALAAGDWLIAGLLLVWWFCSRLIRTFGYWRQHPGRIRYLPAYILYGYINALIKVYALATSVEHSWATRWDKARLQRNKRRLRRLAPVVFGTAAVGLFLLLPYKLVVYIRETSGAEISSQVQVDPGVFNEELNFATRALPQPALPKDAVLPTGVKQYVVQPGDNLNQLATQFGNDPKVLKKLNGLRDADKINVGQTILYYDVSTVTVVTQ